MDLTTFNIDNGYIEAIMRGYRLNFLKEEDYIKMKSFNSLEELWTYLQTEKGYEEMEDSTITIQAIKEQMKKRLSSEIGNNYVLNKFYNILKLGLENLRIFFFFFM